MWSKGIQLSVRRLMVSLNRADARLPGWKQARSPGFVGQKTYENNK